MREVPDDEHEAWVRALRERARLDAEAMVPHPRHLVYGLAAPELTPAALAEHTRVNGESTSITLAYGDEAAPDGPYVRVITSAADAFAVPRAGSTTLDGPLGEASLRFAVEEELDRPADGPETADGPEAADAEAVGPDPGELDEQTPVGWETTPIGRALVGRSSVVWAARLRPAAPDASADAGPNADAGAGAESDVDADADADAGAGVVVTIIGRGLALESVRLALVTDLRPFFEARNALIDARIRRARQRPRPPLPELDPAEGVAALLALAEATLAEHRAISAAHPRRARRLRGDLGWGQLRSALWKRASAEHQRLRGTDRFTADDAVTVAINHVIFLEENAPWFTADPRLRAAAIDETMRHAMLAEEVPSAAAQDAWARSWSARQARTDWRGEDGPPPDPREWMRARRTMDDDCLQAWAAWTATA